MQMGMIGLGRMGANMVRRLLRGGHECVVFDVSADAVKGLVKEGAIGASSLDDFRAKLKKPRVAWMMVPAAVVEKTLADFSDRFEPGDILVDGGNSYYVDDIRRAKALRAKGLHYVDSGTSGGVWGLERGFCQMIGGEPEVVEHLDPIFATLAPPLDSAPRTAGREKSQPSTAEHGYLHCGPNGAGHFVKMVHNGIEYGLMAAYAEERILLRQANVGKQQHAADAETTPLRNPEPVPVRLQSCRYSGSLAPRQRYRFMAARPHRRRARQRSGVEEVRGARLGFRRRAAGRWRRRSTKGFRLPGELTAARYERFSSRGARRLRRQDALGDAVRVRRPFGEKVMNSGVPRSDALVFFGATGDLAYKQIFPALHAMACRGHLEFPVIGVAKSGWTLDQLRARAKESVEKHGGGVNVRSVRPAPAASAPISTVTTRIRRPTRSCSRR